MKLKLILIFVFLLSFIPTLVLSATDNPCDPDFKDWGKITSFTCYFIGDLDPTDCEAKGGVFLNAPPFRPNRKCIYPRSYPKDSTNPKKIQCTDVQIRNGTCADSIIALYVDQIYFWALTVIGFLAGVMIMIGGYLYLTGGGSPDQIEKAKKIIGAAIVGIILLAAYPILKAILFQ